MYSEDLDCWIEKGTRSDRTPVALLLFELYCIVLYQESYGSE